MLHHIVGPLTELKVKLLACRNVAIWSHLCSEMWQYDPIFMPKYGNQSQLACHNVAIQSKLECRNVAADPNQTSITHEFSLKKSQNPYIPSPPRPLQRHLSYCSGFTAAARISLQWQESLCNGMKRGSELLKGISLLLLYNTLLTHYSQKIPIMPKSILDNLLIQIQFCEVAQIP